MGDIRFTKTQLRFLQQAKGRLNYAIGFYNKRKKTTAKRLAAHDLVTIVEKGDLLIMTLTQKGVYVADEQGSIKHHHRYKFTTEELDQI